MPPANDYITAFDRVTVIPEITAFVLKFDTDTLPLSRSNLSLGFAIGIAGLHSLNHIA